MPFAMKISEVVRKRYLERRKRDLEALALAQTSKNFEEFNRIGHQLKGNAPTFGYDELGEIGQRIEAAGMGGEAAAIESSLKELRKWIQDNAKD